MKFDMTYRVSYGDTDQMGVVYYANYLELFERGRTEMLRSAGLTYRDFEQAGYLLPVHEAHCRYHRPAHYDDLLTIRSWIREMRGVRFTVACEILRGDELLAEIKDDVCTLDHTIPFFESEEAVQIFGAEQAKAMAIHARQRKASGAKWCDCPACAACVKIMENEAILRA